MEAGSTEHRLIVRTGFDGADAVLYPVDAGPYTLPDAVVQLVPNQPLPRLTPGEVVLVAADRRWVDVGGHRLTGAPQARSSRSTRVGAHSGSVFAERGDVVVIPPVAVRWWRVHRRRGHLEAATRPAPPGGRPMCVHLWWMLGRDGKPVVVATLRDPDREGGPVHDIPVVCVTGELPDADLMAIVTGDPASGRPITIRSDGLRLASLGPPLPPLASER